MVNIRVAGNIISEISSIPKGTIALIELMKNAYEAKANNLTIKLNQRSVKIIDDGEGMDESDIESLLNISKSNKIYGQKIPGTNRLVSGEKGLGFFAVFKFGKDVSVETIKKNNKRSFNLKLNEIESKNDISMMEIPINLSKSDKHSGTIITISNMNSDFYNAFRHNLLNNESEASRLVHAIDDTNFKIKIYIDRKNIGSGSFLPSKGFSKYKIASLTFNTLKDKDEVMVKDVDNEKIQQFVVKSNTLLNNRKFKLEVKIDFYKFAGKSNGEKGVKYAPKAYIYGNKLFPLIYINDVLFDTNSILYNTEINTTSSNKLVFRQQIGKINIFLQDPNILKFNSDRTSFIESQNLNDLKDLLDDISRTAQKAVYNLSNPSDMVKLNNKSSIKSETKEDIQKKKAKYNKQQKQDGTVVSDNKSASKNTKVSVLNNNNFMILPGYNGNTYTFTDSVNVGELFKELQKLNIKNNKLICLMSIRPIYESSKDLVIKNDLFEIDKSGNLGEAIDKIKAYILNHVSILTKICQQTTKKNSNFSYTTMKTILSNTFFKSEIDESNVFVHRIGEDLKSVDKISVLLQHAYSFSVIIDRWVNITKNNK